MPHRSGYAPSFNGQPPWQGPAGRGNIWTSAPPLFAPQSTYGSGAPGGPSTSGYPHQPPGGLRPRAPSPECYPWEDTPGLPEPEEDDERLARSSGPQGFDSAPSGRHANRPRRPGNRDEFDGPVQFLPPPSPRTLAGLDRPLPPLATHLSAAEQDAVLGAVNARLAACAYGFVARWQFPIPAAADQQRRVRGPGDREWTEWAHLLRRLATKRRVPARVLHGGRIRQLVSVLEGSLEVRHAAAHPGRPRLDDRHVLQLVSAGLQVARILMDADAMEALDELYTQTEALIQARKGQPAFLERLP